MRCSAEPTDIYFKIRSASLPTGVKNVLTRAEPVHIRGHDPRIHQVDLISLLPLVTRLLGLGQLSKPYNLGMLLELAEDLLA
jgi:hypothetical protein